MTTPMCGIMFTDTFCLRNDPDVEYDDIGFVEILPDIRRMFLPGYSIPAIHRDAFMVFSFISLQYERRQNR